MPQQCAPVHLLVDELPRAGVRASNREFEPPSAGRLPTFILTPAANHEERRDTPMQRTLRAHTASPGPPRLIRGSSPGPAQGRRARVRSPQAWMVTPPASRCTTPRPARTAWPSPRTPPACSTTGGWVCTQHLLCLNSFRQEGAGVADCSRGGGSHHQREEKFPLTWHARVVLCYFDLPRPPRPLSPPSRPALGAPAACAGNGLCCKVARAVGGHCQPAHWRHCPHWCLPRQKRGQRAGQSAAHSGGQAF
jgi:hypothetical protein